MTTDAQAQVPWSPFAPPPPANSPARVVDATDPPADEEPSGSSDSAESSATTKPVEKSGPTVDPEPKSEPIQNPPTDQNPVTESRSPLFTLHSENTSEKIEPQVSEGEGMQATLHSPPNSPPTDSNTESPSPGGGSTEGGSAEPNSEGLADEDLTFKTASRAWLLGVGERVRPLAAGLRPPVVWTESPASLQDLVAYATTAPWADRTGPIRMAGRIWCWTVAVPVSTVLYYACWLTQRPSRLIVLAALWGLLAHTSFGSWLPWLWTTA